MLGDSDDSSDDEILKPNGYLDVEADLVHIVDCDEKESGSSPPRKKKKGNSGHVRDSQYQDSFNASLNASQDSFDASLVDESLYPAADPVFVLDDSDIVDSPFVSTEVQRKSRRTARNSPKPPAKAARAKKSSSFTVESNECDSVVLSPEGSPENMFDSTFTPQSSFCIDLEEDTPAPDKEKADPNVEVTVRVLWKGCDTHKFTIRKFQRLKEIYTHYANLEGVEEERILFTLHDKPVSPMDTPSTLNIGVSSLEGGVIDIASVAPHTQQTAESQAQEDPNAIRLLIQRKGIKERHTVYTLPHETIGVLISKISEDLGIPHSSIKLKFDGEVLDLNETPANLDLEGDECLDLVETN